LRPPTGRRGAEGCSPLEQDGFAIGCRIQAADAVLDLDVEIEVRPRSESLSPS
jgi:hypothetical protein